MNTNEDNPDSSTTNDNSAPDAAPAKTSVLADQYGDPFIQGAYAGQTQPDMDVLLPGRQTETAPTADIDKKEGTEEKRAAAPAKLGMQRKQACIVIGVLLCLWIGFYWTQYVRTAGDIEKTATTAADRASSQNQAAISGVPDTTATNSSDNKIAGVQEQDQQTLPTGSTRDEAMALLAGGDKLINQGKDSLAEPFYRRALQILGKSSGEYSWEYQEALSKLAFLLHKMNRLPEEQEIIDYMHRLSQTSFSLQKRD